MGTPVMLYAYRALTWALGPFAAVMLHSRARKGKEDPLRLGERFGRYTLERPAGTLIWMHGASVGESLVLLTLIDAIRAQHGNAHILVTSGTRTSAELIARRAPIGVFHQFIPIDRPGPVRRFLDHWLPDAAIFAESEIWPNLILETRARGIPMSLVNARMNTSSLERWMKWRASGQALLSAFSWIGAADQRTARGLSQILDADIPFAGNLKLDAPVLLADQTELNAIKAEIADRPVWLAASTHEGEDETLLSAHQLLSKTQANPLMVLAPRHPERGDALAALIAGRGLNLARRSLGETPTAETSVWLADTLGEMPLWYGLAAASFIAGSLIDGIGGHNPIEASRCGSAVLSGPYTASFDDVFNAYRDQRAVFTVADAIEISDAVTGIWAGHGPSREAVDAALTNASGGALTTTMTALRPLLAGALS